MCKQNIEKPSLKQKAEGSFGPLWSSSPVVGRGCRLPTSSPYPQEAAVGFHHPASRWETQSKNSDSKVIPQYACKFHRALVRALVVNQLSLAQKYTAK